MSDKIKVTVCGVCGKMGMETAKAITAHPATELVGGVDLVNIGVELETLIGIKGCKVKVSENLNEVLPGSDCLVDFTNGSAAPDNIKAALNRGVPCIVGATGIETAAINELAELAEEKNTPVLIVPNFSIGAVLMMEFAEKAAKYFESAEIIELHHDKKLDAPSGTACMTAQRMAQANRGVTPSELSKEKIEHVRGGNLGGIQIHSVRLPGFTAHQEVLFGGLGEILTIKHDSMSRISFMPGVIKAIEKIRTLKGLLFGLEHVL